MLKILVGVTIYLFFWIILLAFKDGSKGEDA